MATAIDEDLRLEIFRLYNEDQALLTELGEAENDPAFAEEQDRVKELVLAGEHVMFWTSRVLDAWAEDESAPDVVKRKAAFDDGVAQRLKEIANEYGWPRRAIVGDDAAFFVYFLFGHADSHNDWRRTLLPTIEELFRDGEIPDPRLYAHLIDRIEAVAGNPQVFGSIMGPADGRTLWKDGSTAPDGASEARLYWPLRDSSAEVDARRAEIGLPSMEDDLRSFREGAVIGPYMTPTFPD